MVLELIMWLKSIPDVVWAAVIASVLTITGVIVTNIWNKKCLMLQLKHISNENDKEREMNLRRDIYLPAVEATTSAISFLARLPDVNISEYNTLSEKLGMAMAKIEIIANMGTITAVAAVNEKFTVGLLDLTSKRVPLMEIEGNIQLFDKIIQKNTVERDKTLEQMKEFNAQHITDEGIWKIVKDHFDDTQAEVSKYLEKLDKERERHYKLKLEFLLECIRTGINIQKMLPSAVIAIRKELGLLIDEAEYQKLCQKSLDTLESKFETFLSSLQKDK
jgi:heme exporter protein D